MNTIFESAFKCMPTPAFIIESHSGKVLSCNNNFQALFENFSATPADSWEDLCDEATSIEDWKALNEKIQNGIIERCESLIRMGKKRVNMQLEFQHFGESVLVCVYDTDHMNLASAENTLLQFALTESSTGLWVWDTESDLISCSKSIATILDCSLEETPHSNTEWQNRVHPDDTGQIGNLVKKHLTTNQDYYEVEYRFQKSDQTYLWVKEHAKVYIRNTDGSIKKVVGFIADISHQKDLEEHLRNQATFDELTGLLTRGAAITHFKKQLGLAKRQYTPLTMAKIHLDTNNRLTKLPMEERNIAIQTSARHIYKKVREADVLARVENDKLLLLLPNTSVRDAKALLNHIINPTEEERSLLSDGNASSTDFCIGIATFPEDGETIEELALSANQALEKGQAEHQKIVVN